jgi:hypothetical protein
LHFRTIGKWARLRTKVTTRWKITGALGLMVTLVGLDLQLASVESSWPGWALIIGGLAVGMRPRLRRG